MIKGKSGGTRTLAKLTAKVDSVHKAGPAPNEVRVLDITVDSRTVDRGSLFIAVSGSQSDGHDYVEEVLRKKCSAIVVSQERYDSSWNEYSDTSILVVADTRKAYAEMAAAFFFYPQNSLKFIGITGTNGKTTVTYLLENILQKQGVLTGVIGTINYRYINKKGERKSIPAPYTTPEPFLLQQTLRTMVDEGVETVVMEISSHALDQGRIGEIVFDVAAFTNLSRDHLDYHNSLDQYFKAKSLLFLKHLKKDGMAVVTHRGRKKSQDNNWAKELENILQKNGVSYTTCGAPYGSSVVPTSFSTNSSGTEIHIEIDNQQRIVQSPLVGDFNIDNIMTTLCINKVMGGDSDKALATLQETTGVPGRLERILPGDDIHHKPTVFVDYAHTPDALKNVLSTLKSLPHNKLICVFGCGGDRDKGKRPEMGKIAAEFSDRVILTDDNPRTESSEKILQNIIEGVVSAGMSIHERHFLFKGASEKGCVVIENRKEAIHQAIISASQGDLVLLAGKGHEKYQITNSGRRFFDDSLEAKEALMNWDVERVKDALSLQHHTGSERSCFAGISTDSRSIKHNELFVALSGENFDGHDYIEDIAANGAGGVVVSKKVDVLVDHTIPVFTVSDTLTALGDLASYRRKKIGEISSPFVIGITGSCGKTTVKEMVTSILQQYWPDNDTEPVGRVLKTQGNFNNLIGLPLSLLPLEIRHRAAVLEMGMNQPGEIARLAEIADPDISCIVNVHGAHLEGLGTIEGVAKAKEELFAGTKRSGKLIVNCDNQHVAALAEKYTQKKFYYSLDPENRKNADVWADNIVWKENGTSVFTLHIARMSREINLQVPGAHTISNSLAAAAICSAADVDIDTICRGLEQFRPADKRMQIMKTPEGFSIINDTYNANPASMAAGLHTLKTIKGGRKLAILGDMLELGGESEAAHRELGRQAAAADLDYLIVVGSFSRYIASGASEAGFEQSRLMVAGEKAEIFSIFMKLMEKDEFGDGDWVLIKASRGLQLETVVTEILG